MSSPNHSPAHRSCGIQSGRRFLLSAIAALSCSCNGEPGILVDIATWPDGVERIRVRTTLEGTLGADSYVNKSQTRFAVRLPAGSTGTVRLDVDGLDKMDCKLVSGELTEQVPMNLGHFLERSLELTPFPSPKCIFEKSINYPTGLSPLSMVAGDFNGDMILDLATANYSGNNVSVLFGDGRGNFGSAVSFPVGKGPSWLAIGDFNSDQKQDLAVANNGEKYISILLGNGQGGFFHNAVPEMPMGEFAGPYTLAVGDFTLDGKEDVAVVSFGTQVDVLQGKGDGSFGIPPIYSKIPSYARAIAIGDFNRDTRLDFVTTTPNAARTMGFVRVHINNGNGFSSGQMVSVENGDSAPAHVAVGDFNGDAIADLVSVNSVDGKVSVLLGDGTGSFGPPANFATGAEPVAVAISDFNRDRNQDLAVVNYSGKSISVLIGDGKGAFIKVKDFSVGQFPTAIAVGDFNGDLRPDLAVAKKAEGNISVFLNEF